MERKLCGQKLRDHHYLQGEKMSNVLHPMVVWVQYLHQRSGGPSPPSSHRGGHSCSPEAGTESQAAVPLLSRDALMTATHSNCQQQRKEELNQAGVLEICLFRYTALTVEVNKDQILQCNCCTFTKLVYYA